MDKLTNVFGEEFTREKPLTSRDLEMIKDTIVIYLAMGDKSSIDKELKKLSETEARLVCGASGREYITSRMRYGY